MTDIYVTVDHDEIERLKLYLTNSGILCTVTPGVSKNGCFYWVLTVATSDMHEETERARLLRDEFFGK
jgi:hypothetical protein